MTPLEFVERRWGTLNAKRSGTPYMKHIYQGLAILEQLKADNNTKTAYALHGMFQSNDDLVKTYKELSEVEYRAEEIILVMEYRHVANSYLSYMPVPDSIDLGPFNEVKLMLIADKVQNRFEFELNHNKHENADRLATYFTHWLSVLGVNEEQYSQFCELFK